MFRGFNNYLTKIIYFGFIKKKETKLVEEAERYFWTWVRVPPSPLSKPKKFIKSAINFVDFFLFIYNMKFKILYIKEKIKIWH